MRTCEEASELERQAAELMDQAARAKLKYFHPECFEQEEPPTLKCDCKDWKPGMEKINAPIVLEQTRGGFVYPDDHFIKMKFCPWCGMPLKEKNGQSAKIYQP